MTDGWIQYEGVYLGGGQGEGVTVTMHKACGAYIGDREQHEKVCTAPPWQPTPAKRTIVDYFTGGGRRETR